MNFLANSVLVDSAYVGMMIYFLLVTTQKLNSVMLLRWCSHAVATIHHVYVIRIQMAYLEEGILDILL